MANLESNEIFTSSCSLDELLFEAASAGKKEDVEKAVKGGADINYTSSSDKTALNIATEKGHTDIVRILIDNGADKKFHYSLGATTTALHVAAEKSHSDILQLLIDKGIDVNIKDSFGMIPLHYAVESGGIDVVTILISNGADVNAVDKFWMKTPLHFAAKSRCENIVILLLSNGADVNAVDEDQLSPLHYAAKYGVDNVVTILINNGANVNAVDKYCMSHLHFAADNGHENVATILINNGADINALDKYWMRTPVHYATKGGHENIVALLINNGADINIGDKFWRINLIYNSVKDGHDNVVALLINTGVDVNTEIKDQMSLLHYAAIFGHENVVAVLLNNGANINFVDKNVKTPLHYAVQGGYENVASILLNNGANVNAVDKDQLTPIHYAAENDNMDMVTVLLKHRACVNNEDEVQKTLLHYAAKEGNENTVTILINNGADVNIGGESQWTPLHYAAARGHDNIVTVLLNNEADINIRDKWGYTPLHLACQSGYVSVVSHLLSLPDINPAPQNYYNQTPIELVHPYLSSRTMILQLFERFKSCRTNFPIQSYTKVILCGNTAVGKSSLTRVIIVRSENKLDAAYNPSEVVTGVTLLTAGIEPHTIISHEIGNIILYDFAGHPEYYSSHAAVLENLMLHSPAVFVIVFSLTSTLDSVEKELYYWFNFIESVSVRLSEASQVLVVGSHADLVSCIDDYCDLIEDAAENGICKQNYRGFVAVDCHRPGGIGVAELIDKLGKSCKDCLKSSGSISYYCHILYSFLTDLKMIAINEEELIFRLKEANHPALPSDPPVVSQFLSVLSDKGLILYLPSTGFGWIIIDKNTLLTEINGVLFAPQVIKRVHRRMASNTGIIPFSALKKAFPAYDPLMLVGFLISLEFCHKFNASILKSVSTNLSPLTPSEISSDDLLFFPSLTNDVSPDSVSFDPLFGWCLWCPNPHQFLSTRFLQVLILRLGLRCLPVGVQPGRLNVNRNLAREYERRCVVWKNGIFWSRKGIKVLVEVSEANRCITLFLSEKDGKRALKECSYVLNEIRSLKANMCPCESNEYVIAPDCATLEVRLVPTSERCLISLSFIAEALLRGKKSVCDMQKEEFSTSSVISDCESYMKLHPVIINELFDDKKVTLHGDYFSHFQLCCPLACKGCTVSDCTKLLKERINKFSLFTGLNPLSLISDDKRRKILDQPFSLHTRLKQDVPLLEDLVKIFNSSEEHYSIIGVGLGVKVTDLLQLPNMTSKNLIFVFERWIDGGKDVNWKKIVNVCSDYPDKLGKAKAKLKKFLSSEDAQRKYNIKIEFPID